MAKKKKEQFDIIPVIVTDRTSLAESIKRIGDLQRTKTELSKNINDQIAKLQEKLTLECEPIDKEIQELALGIKLFMDENRETVIPPEKKSVELPTGTVAYRDKTPKVLTRVTDKFIAAYLEKHGLTDFYEKTVKKFSKFFLTIKIELDKQAILKQQQKARDLGIEIEGEKERFYIKPASVNEEIEVAA